MTGRTSVIGRKVSMPEMRNQAGVSGGQLFFFVEDGDVTFGDIQVRPLLM